MADFSDRLMLRYLTPANVDSLLVPQGDLNHDRVRALLAEVYQMRLLRLESVDAISVLGKSFQVPLVESHEVRAVWDKITPHTERSLGTFTLPSRPPLDWIDMTLETRVTVKVSVASGALDAVGSADVSKLSQQEFLQKFQFLDLQDLMKTARVTTYAELQADFPRLYNLHYAEPPPFNPADPAVIRTYLLRVSVLFFPTLDLQGALRQLATSKREFDGLRPVADGFDGGDLLGASAWIAIFPASAITAQTPSQSDVMSLLAAQGFVAVFETV